MAPKYAGNSVENLNKKVWYDVILLRLNDGNDVFLEISLQNTFLVDHL